MIHSFPLHEGSPIARVWLAQCDVCDRWVRTPYLRDGPARDAIIADGWRSVNTHPMDTCPDCLAREETP
ncbi:hypothetical protein [Brevibacterium sandarakinum]|uniref:hypothetical protein n=1 Tax=Brevibacterium sandarakinum TaxID=629680 RepID=UPI00264F839C|nr:hypothetical protein [Brevibacterium sandarakinum]MDN5659015.1 hypothetical protein [Brevibacterium sandarakinum]